MKVYLDTIGCRLNQSEIEKMAAQFASAGHDIVADAAEADLVVVNTCAVTREAAADSRQLMRRAARAGHARVVATGCWATLDPEAAAALPAVMQVVKNEDKDNLVASLLEMDQDCLEIDERKRLPGQHARTRAFIKVQDGCNNACTFCITRVARGRGRSRLLEDVLRDIDQALAGEAREVVLTGVHLGSWGQDFENRLHLSHLIEAILTRTDVPRLRLSSLEPWDLDRSFFELWSDPRLCPHLHLPLQSGSAAILKRMARKTTPEAYANLLEEAHRLIPDLAVTTDLIVGFPGEGESEFAESREFVRRMVFAAGHVFHFSPRPGTPAAHFSGQVAPAISKQRSAEMRALFADLSKNYRQTFINRELQVLWETAQKQPDGSWLLEGLTGNYLRVKVSADSNLWNQISRVRVTQLSGEGLAGFIVSE
ncbi:MAG: tRNA (N(6)-L-threonylcarbamoyladenosine(37)-C(2))-methylthiotransferase MtaB [Anaerolineae bacterium]|nr:tRNA (N(6)-L-threonylcarbamoyladenosine(37)-C(2))-methylthiotransferase MtaB [Anaerolineae bacterium]